jgi:peptidoglycan/LPS O-acetylase OafA/YrhL
MKRIPQIDGLRALAILLVISFHYINNQLTGASSKIAKFFYFITSFGWAGVDLFFVLSGFLIGTILITNRQKDNYFSTFYIRRFVRIIPNYYLLIVVFIIISQISIFSTDYFVAGNKTIPTWSYFFMVHNLYMAALHNMGNSAMSVTWSIGIEEQFYLIIPFIIYYLKPKLLPFLLVCFIILANIFRFFHPVLPTEHFSIAAYVLLPCRMDAISFGVLIAWINCNYNLTDLVNKYFFKIIALMLSIVILCGLLVFLYKDIGIIRNSLFALFFACAIVVGLAKPQSLYGNFLGNKLLNWIGKISYSLYLFHYLILGVCIVIGEKIFLQPTSIERILISIVALAFSFTFSWLVYKYLETPFVKLGKKANYK